jgi:predicted ATPase
LGVSLLATRGFAAPEVGEAYARADELCQQTGETSKLYAVLQGLCFFHVVRAEFNQARELAEHCYAVAQRDADPVLLLAAQNALSQVLTSAGEFGTARDHLDRALRVED